jgi:hypothetical protein
VVVVQGDDGITLSHIRPSIFVKPCNFAIFVSSESIFPGKGNIMMVALVGAVSLPESCFL